ncbi:MAG: DinB family protein [Chloroflexi bacterium]|nr:DinB family protein [Chloroflexota bacterium]
MEAIWKNAVNRQFTSAIDMLENSLRACPDQLWVKPMWADSEMPAEFSAFWYVAYHALFWVDLYLSGSIDGFNPPAPFTLSELDPAGKLPERNYTRAELLNYLAHCRQKCQVTLNNLSEDRAKESCYFSWGEVSFAELLLDNMRHTQEHAAQLDMFLGQQTGRDSKWISGARKSQPGMPANG